MKKICQQCHGEFFKKSSHSQKYWKTARFCSLRCSRAGLPNPKKTIPNNIITQGGDIGLIIKTKHGKFVSWIDKHIYEKDFIKKYQWHCRPIGYVYRKSKGPLQKNISLHCEIMGSKEGYVVDHIDGNPLNNRLSNLRHLTHKDNVRNQKIKNKTGVIGGRITPSGKISVRIRDNSGEQIHLGTFDSVDEATQERIEAEKKYWGHSYLEEKLNL